MLRKLPKRLAILGAGAVGMEFAYIMNSFGVEVTVIEMLDRILPMEDAEAGEVVRTAFEKNGVRFMVGTKAFSLDRGRGAETELRLSVGGAAASNASEAVSVDSLLVSIGRVPNTAGLGLEQAGVRLDRGGYVETGDYYETSAADVYAIGDIVKGEPQLAHVASAQGEIAVERIAERLGKGPGPRDKRLDLDLIPSAVYCAPQLAGFGPRPEKLKAAGIAHRTSVFPFRGVGKAVAIGEMEGFVKIVTDERTGAILSAVLVGPEATELVHELLLAKKAELLPEDVFSVVHAHPTLSEAVKEAALAADGRALHI
jgi:dihydrolipoamide dehydrogenase